MTLVVPTQHWVCPNCTVESVTHEARPHTRFHVCGGLAGGLTAPMVSAGTKADVRAVEREDYIGGDKVRFAPNGRPIMAVVTERNDGEDRVVFAPTATGGST